MLGKIEGKKGTIEDEMVGWHHRLNEHEFGEVLKILQPTRVAKVKMTQYQCGKDGE